MNIQIKKATVSFLHPLSELFDLYRVFYHKKSDVEAARLFLEERLSNNDSEIFVAEAQNGELLGFTQLYPLFSSTRMQRLWLLNDLYVQEHFRGKGISKCLIEEAKKLAVDTHACGVMLETAKTNEIGNKLYPAVGFEWIEESNFYFWNKI